MVEPIPLRGVTHQPEVIGLWHIRLTVAGERVEPGVIADAMADLAGQSPFLTSIRYDEVHAQISYWDEADVLDDVAALALRLWHDHRRDASLPDWRPVGLEVLDRASYAAVHRGHPTSLPTGDVRHF